jgi:regulator of protease activity HflC (stomatin/prohibitin superfamily)
VVFRLGRYVGVRGPGLVLLIPFIERMVKIELRVLTMDVPAQECITIDTVTVKVDAVVYFRVIKPEAAVLNVEQFIRATSLLCQTTLRNVVGQSDLEDLLAHRDKVNEKLQMLIDEGTEPWGIKVSMVEVRDVQMPETMQRAMAAQAEAERERRAKIVHADGEFQAAQKLADAAAVISSQPSALQLRYLQTLVQISTERTNTIVFPLPIELIQPMLMKMLDKEKKQA